MTENKKNRISGNSIAPEYNGFVFNVKPYNISKGGIITLNGAAAAGKGTIAKQLKQIPGLENILVLTCSDLLNHKTLSNDEESRLEEMKHHFENGNDKNLKNEINHYLNNSYNDKFEMSQFGILDLLRKKYGIEALNNTEKKDDIVVNFYQTLGKLVPQNLYNKRAIQPTIEIFKQNINPQIILDGFTRTNEQVYDMNKIIKKHSTRNGIDASLFVDIETEIAVQRAIKRSLENPGARNDVDKTESRVLKYKDSVPNILSAHNELEIPSYLMTSNVAYKNMGDAAIKAFNCENKYNNKFTIRAKRERPSGQIIFQ